MTFTKKRQKLPQRYRQTVPIADEEGRNIVEKLSGCHILKKTNAAGYET